MIVLDTHALIWWVDGQTGELGRQARIAIDREHAGGEILVSSITAWEIALLVTRGRLRLSVDLENWLRKVERIAGLGFVPVDNLLAVAAVNLPGDLHRDPADRIIVATARRLDAPLVTSDARLRGYPHVRTIW